MAYAGLYSWFTHKGLWPDLYFPAAPFWLGAAVSLCGLLVALRLPSHGEKYVEETKGLLHGEGNSDTDCSDHDDVLRRHRYSPPFSGPSRPYGFAGSPSSGGSVAATPHSAVSVN
eukprot:TRINITY_DN26299_c0_g1_i1.p3 TRINITY_DN26299_c0_g1~~TRINITY_DN26299_c0_g1_i1.p3  ORF type:complete len:115 (-),score=15.61 TRINITY_DN26299_c0_g1_i1:406-750(-)